MGSTLDLTGRRFDRLVVIRRDGSHRAPSGTTFPTWLVRCDCKTTKVVQGRHLLNGDAKSCGCFKREKEPGVSRLPEYAVWAAMIQRCSNPNDRGFKNFGGRGIMVCRRWLKSFTDFLADMGPRPTAKHSVERVDNNGPYAPENCVWGTRLQQNRNRRHCRLLTVGGRTQLMTDWARERNISVATIHKRLRRRWTSFRAVMTPAKPCSTPAPASS